MLSCYSPPVRVLPSFLSIRVGSQKRAIHEPEGRDESRLALKLKINLDFTIVKYILSLFGQTLSLFGQTICPGLRTLCLRRLRGAAPLLTMFSALIPPADSNVHCIMKWVQTKPPEQHDHRERHVRNSS